MSRLDDIEQHRAVKGTFLVAAADVDWLIAEVKRLTAAEERVREVRKWIRKTANFGDGSYAILARIDAALDGDGVQE